MPGIAGIVGEGPIAENDATVQAMVACMLHEPFYRSGSHSIPSLCASAGWTARGGSFSDCMPVWNETRDICLLFAGEVFPDPDETNRLRARGHEFDRANASYLVHLYEELGSCFVSELSGWFSGLVLDCRENKIHLFTDRFGLHRLYFSETGGRVYFASEAKALLKVLPQLRQLNMASVAEFFSCGCVLRNRTLFEGVSVIPPGSMWTFNLGGGVSRNRYFTPEAWEGQEQLGPAEFYEKLKEVFPRILRRYCHGAEHLGVSLTGGVDSRMIMAWAKAAPGTLPCYTFGGIVRESIDVSVARQVAAICGQSHQVLTAGEEFLSQFPSLAEKCVYLTDGVMDVSGSADLYVNGLARQIAPARLTGNYGGEILRSIVAFKPYQIGGGILHPDFEGLTQGAARSYFQELDTRRLSFIAFKQVPWHHHSRFTLEQSQISIRTPYLDNELVALAFQIPMESAQSNDASLRLISDGDRRLSAIGTDRGVLHQSLPVVSEVMHWYQELVFRAEYAFDYGMPQWMAKVDTRLSRLHLERYFLGRHKFYHFRSWYRHALSSYVKDVLLDPSSLSRPYHGRPLEDAVRSHTEGRGNYTLEIHRMLTVELIQKTLIDMT